MADWPASPTPMQDGPGSIPVSGWSSLLAVAVSLFCAVHDGT